MCTRRVSDDDELYRILCDHFGKYTPDKLIVCFREDCKTFELVEHIDYGTHDLKIKDGDSTISVTVEHKPKTADNGASLLITTETAEQFKRLMHIVENIRELDPSRLVEISYWENSGWRSSSSIYVSDTQPTPQQKIVFDYCDDFYKSGQLFKEHNLPYQRGILLAGPSATGKQWLIRHLAYSFSKCLRVINVNEETFPELGLAIRNVAHDTIIVLTGLEAFYSQCPTQERGQMLRKLSSHLNQDLFQPRGVLIIATVPTHTAPELLRFLMMPQRFSKRFELTLAEPAQLQSLLKPLFKGDKAAKVANRLAQANVPAPTLRWFLADKEGLAADALEDALESLAVSVREERGLIDVSGRIGSERLYS